MTYWIHIVLRRLNYINYIRMVAYTVKRIIGFKLDKIYYIPNSLYSSPTHETWRASLTPPHKTHDEPPSHLTQHLTSLTPPSTHDTWRPSLTPLHKTHDELPSHLYTRHLTSLPPISTNDTLRASLLPLYITLYEPPSHIYTWHLTSPPSHFYTWNFKSSPTPTHESWRALPPIPYMQ